MYCANSAAKPALGKVNSAGTPSSFPSAHPMKQLDASARVPSQAARDSSTFGDTIGFVACICCAAFTHALYVTGKQSGSDGCSVSACRKTPFSANGGGGGEGESGVEGG